MKVTAQSILGAILIANLCFMSTVKAASYTINMGQIPVFEADPMIVSSVSKFLLGGDGIKKFPDEEPFVQGDCLELDFAPIAAYAAKLPSGSQYELWPGTVQTATTAGAAVDCTGLSWLPATTDAGITCTLVTNFRV